MAIPGQDGSGDSDRAFLESSYFTYIIPAATNFVPEDALRPGDTPFPDQLSAIEQREQLFFGTRLASPLPLAHGLRIGGSTTDMFNNNPRWWHGVISALVLWSQTPTPTEKAVVFAYLREAFGVDV